MGRYNVHKRATLDRLTLRYQLQMQALLKADASRRVGELTEAFESGARIYYPSADKLRPAIEEVFQRHQDQVIHVAVSDGIQEISPTRELSLWLQHPLAMPVEDTLGVALANKRDDLVKKIQAEAEAKNAAKAGKLAASQLATYLESLQKAYSRIARGWLDGDGSRDDVTRALREALGLSGSAAERTFRTETTNYFNRARWQYFDEVTAAEYMQLYAVTDGRISEICADRHGFVVTMEQASQKRYMPAFHPHCRTIQRPLLMEVASHRKQIEAGLRMNEASFTPLPRGWAA